MQANDVIFLVIVTAAQKILEQFKSSEKGKGR